MVARPFEKQPASSFTILPFEIGTSGERLATWRGPMSLETFRMRNVGACRPFGWARVADGMFRTRNIGAAT